MSTAQQTSCKAAVRRFIDAANTGDAELLSETIDELVEPDALIRTPLPIEATGAELVQEVFARLLRAYPDLHITIEDLVEEEDKVVSCNMVTGTHLGQSMGIPPTGKSVTYNEIFIAPLRGRPNRRDLGGRRRPLADATARPDSRRRLMTTGNAGFAARCATQR
jgi:predicted ester cyclase